MLGYYLRLIVGPVLIIVGLIYGIFMAVVLASNPELINWNKIVVCGFALSLLPITAGIILFRLRETKEENLRYQAELEELEENQENL